MALDLSTLTPEEAITAFYIGYYERAADPAGLAFWTDVLEMTSLDLAAIASDFASQDETLDAHPFFSNPTEEAAGVFIAELYLNLFERADVDAEGLQFWTDVLLGSINGTNDMSVGEIIIAIIAGAQDTEAGNDRTTILNKIEVATAFTAAADANGIVAFPEGSEILAESSSIIADVTDEGTTVVGAKTKIGEFFSDTGGGGGVAGEFFVLEEGRKSDTGTDGNDTFEAFNAELQDGDRIDGGSGRDVLTYFNSVDGVAKSPITTGVEQFVITNQSNDLNAVADNNVGGYSTNSSGLFEGASFDGTIEVDVEIDGGMMSGINRWENHDSRADVVIEDARDLDDTDGTFTGDITVAMVSTDPGNVDYAVYFDGPTNTAQNFGTIELRVLDQEAAEGLPQPSASSTGYLTEASLVEFRFEYEGQEITVTLADELGVTYGPNVTFQDLREQIEAATAQALEDAGITGVNAASSFGAPVSVGVGNQFTLPIILTFDVPADTIQADPNNIIVLGRDSGNNNATDTFGALSTDRQTVEELIRLNVELDDVGKGSMGGDAMFGAMSTGRQTGDDGTSDSIGIQQFDIEVDRSSQLQTIASTNNALQVVNITNGENNGPNNTTTAADEQIGDLVVRGVANPGEISIESVEIDAFNSFFGFNNIATDSPMPGAVPQHNTFGFTDVRVINAAQMIGAVDITAVLTQETVEKYLDIQDSQPDGEDDDVLFDYDLGTNNDEFLLEMSADALSSAGTGSREDFNLDIDGNNGNDVITTNIGTYSFDEAGTAPDPILTSNLVNGAVKVIDAQGQDHYLLTSTNAEGWYENSVSNVAAEFAVDGGAGNDVIWTHGWGDFTINDGTGMDVVYTDNSGAFEISGNNGTGGLFDPATALDAIIDRNLNEHEQIDYVYGAAWAYNAEFTGPNAFDITGVTNDRIEIASAQSLVNNTLTSGSVDITVEFFGAGGSANAGTAYSVTVQIPQSEMILVSNGATPPLFDIFVTDQAINQAIKKAVNDQDYVLSNMLEAADGPGNSLAVYTKSDGVHVENDLQISIGNVVLNNGTPIANITDQAAFDASYAGAANDDGGTGRLFEGTVSNDASTSESDNLINVAGDDASDLFVLSTNDTFTTFAGAIAGTLEEPLTDLNGASNEVLKFAANFGTDTILNFDDATNSGGAAGTDASEDVLDFSLITGGANSFAGATFANNDNEVVINTVAAVDDSGAVDPGVSVQAAEAVAFFLANGGTDDTTSAGVSDHILITWDATGDNGGTVWHITDGSGNGDVAAVDVGMINLVGTNWTDITADNIA